MDIELTLEAHAIIGESPTWSPHERALYWIDVKEPALHRYEPENGAHRRWVVTSDLGAFALMDHGAALVALRFGIHRLDLKTGALDLLAPAPFDPKMFRFNEGLCDSNGRFWVGVMFDPIEGSPPPTKAALHSFSLNQGLRRENDQAQLHNGMALSLDGHRLFLAHSYSGLIYAFDFDPQAGLLGPKQLFAQVPTDLGIPDGAAIDAEGGYWCALHGAGRIRRYRPDGRPDRDIMLPVSKPTMCAFAGDDLESLYVTSASDGLSAHQLHAEPHAGALFRLRVGVRGTLRPSMVR